MNPDTTTLLTFQDVCQILVIRESKLRSLVFKKQIPVVKLPGTRLLRFDAKAIEAWIKQTKNSEA